MKYTFSDNRKVLNRGVNGDNTFDLLSRLQSDVLMHHPKAAIVMVGTNDALNGGNLVEINQYKKNLATLVKRLKASNIFVLLVTPPMVDDEILRFPNKDNLTCNQLLQPYRAQVIHVAKELEVPCLDMFGEFKKANKLKSHLMNLSNSNRNDGAHPTAEGYIFMAKTIYNKLLEIGAPLDRIVCFGDSITFGYLVKNEGQEIGESYPAVLNQLLTTT